MKRYFKLFAAVATVSALLIACSKENASSNEEPIAYANAITCDSTSCGCGNSNGTCDSTGRGCGNGNGTCDSTGRGCGNNNGTCDSTGRGCGNGNGTCDSTGRGCGNGGHHGNH